MKSERNAKSNENHGGKKWKIRVPKTVFFDCNGKLYFVIFMRKKREKF